MDILVVALEEIERSAGSFVKEGEIVRVPPQVAELWIDRGKACLYSNYCVDVANKAKGKRRNAAVTNTGAGDRDPADAEKAAKDAEKQAAKEAKAAEKAAKEGK